MRKLLITALFLGLFTAVFAGDGGETTKAKSKSACCATTGEVAHECLGKAEPVKTATKTKEDCSQKACCKSKKAKKAKKAKKDS